MTQEEVAAEWYWHAREVPMQSVSKFKTFAPFIFCSVNIRNLSLLVRIYFLMLSLALRFDFI
jgi:hypothetical protein